MAVSFQVETAPMAGKSWQHSHGPHIEGIIAGTHDTDQTVEREGGAGEGK